MSRFSRIDGGPPSGSLDEFLLGLSPVLTYHACPVLAVLLRGALEILDREDARHELLAKSIGAAGARPHDSVIMIRVYRAAGFAARVLLPISMERHPTWARSFSQLPEVTDEHSAYIVAKEIERVSSVSFADRYILDAVSAAAGPRRWLPEEVPVGLEDRLEHPARRELRNHSEINRMAIRVANATGAAVKAIANRQPNTIGQLGVELSSLILRCVEVG